MNQETRTELKVGKWFSPEFTRNDVTINLEDRLTRQTSHERRQEVQVCKGQEYKINDICFDERERCYGPSICAWWQQAWRGQESAPKVTQETISCSTMKRLPSITMSKWTDRPWGLDGLGWQYLGRYPPSCYDVKESSIFPQMTSLLIWINLAFWPSSEF